MDGYGVLITKAKDCTRDQKEPPTLVLQAAVGVQVQNTMHVDSFLLLKALSQQEKINKDMPKGHR